MSYKAIILSLLLLSVLTAATAGYRWWEERVVTTPPSPSEPSALTELQKLMRLYHRGTDSSESVSGTIHIYDREKKDSLKESKTFRYVHSGGSYYMQLSYLQTFCNGQWIVQLDTFNRQITVAKGQGTPPGDITSLVGPLETLFSDTVRFRTSGEVRTDGSLRSLRVQSELNPSIRSSTLYYDTLYYRLERAEIEWWKPGALPDEKGDKIWLVKITYQYPPAEKIDLRKKMGSVVSIDGARVTPAAAYHDYTLNVNN